MGDSHILNCNDILLFFILSLQGHIEPNIVLLGIGLLFIH